MLIDTHCHLTYPELAAQIEAVLERASAAGVGRMVTVATSTADAGAALRLLERFPQVALAAGIHPHEAGKCTGDDLDALARLHRGGVRGVAGGDERLVAVGETGLDFHYDFAPRERQEEVFRFQLQLAIDVGRPVVIHARRSEGAVCDILGEYPALAGRVVFHCYSGDAALARRILEMGNYVSFTGVVTFANATDVQAAARLVPGDRFMVETDAPYLSPEPVRKRRPNEPAFVAHTAAFVARLRNEPAEELAVRTTETARRFFGLRRGDGAGELT